MSFTNINKLNLKIKEALNEEYDLEGINGNAFNILSYVAKAMKEQGFSEEEISTYRTEAKESDYDNLLRVSMLKLEECNKRLNEKTDNEVKDFLDNYDNVSPKEGDFEVTFGPGTYYIGDICYCLKDEEYDKIWGDKYNYANGTYGFFAVGGTSYGDGMFYSGRWVFPVDAGVIGVVEMSHSKEPEEVLEGEYGRVVHIKKSLTFKYDKSGIFNFNIDGRDFSINTRDDDEEDEEEDW